MNLGDYTFEIGDRVITTFGEVGRIVDICKCDNCAKRGFFEPIWVEDDVFIKQHITDYDLKYGFDTYYQIGKYRFDHPLNKGLVTREIDGLERNLKKYKKMLANIEAIEKRGVIDIDECVTGV